VIKDLYYKEMKLLSVVFLMELNAFLKAAFYLRRNRRRNRNQSHNAVGTKNLSGNQIVRSGIGSLDMNLKPRHEVKERVL